MSHMKRIIFLFLFGGLTIVFPALGFSADQSQKPWTAQIERLTKLSEEEIDIGLVSLELAKEVYPDLDVKKYSEKIDRMVEDVRKLTNGSKDPDHRIRMMDNYFYLDQGIHYDQDDPYAKQLKNRYLNGILDSNSGSCTTMPLLYLAIAQRLGYPIYPVAAPQHLFLRYVSPGFKEDNIEVTGGGAYVSNEDMIYEMEIPQKGVESGTYLATMTLRQLLGDLIAENGLYWSFEKKEYERGTKYIEIGLSLNPKNAEMYRAISDAYYKLAGEYEKFERGLPDSDLLPGLDPAIEQTKKIYRNLLPRDPAIEETKKIYRRRNHLDPRGLPDDDVLPKPDAAIEQTKKLYRWYRDVNRRKGDLYLHQANLLGVAPRLQKDYWVKQKERALRARKL